MNKSVLATLVIFLLSSVTLAGQTPDATSYFSFLTAADRQTLVAKGELTGTGKNWAEMTLGPRAPFAADVTTGMPLRDATVAAEGLFLFPRPSGNVELGLYNAVNAVASMEGLQYFSVTRNQMEPLILGSWRVSGIDRPQKLPDPVFTAIPPFQRAVVYQKDNKLGEGMNEVTWKSLTNGTLVMTFRNLEQLNYGILPLVAPGNLQMLFVVIPLADKVAVYGVMQAKTGQLFGLERSKDESFRNRMRALASWLGQRIATLK